MNPRPLDRLYSSPRQLLEKAARDAERLDAATQAWEERASIDAMVDAASSVYHVKDWIGALHPGHKAAAQACVGSSKWILICRDICHAGKHVALTLSHSTYKKDPPMVAVVDYTIGASVGTLRGLPVLKVFTQSRGDHYATDVISRAIADWEEFLDDRGIA